MSSDRAEWLDWRRGGIGSSDIAAIIGLSPWATAYSVWAEKTGRLDNHDNDDTVKEFGRRAEAMIGPWFADLTGLNASDWQHRAEHPTWPTARCTADALVYEPTNSCGQQLLVGALEMKSTGWQRDWDEIPDHYDAQVQWQLEVLDLDHAWIAALHGRRLAVYPIARRRDEGAWLLDTARRFWEDHVQADLPPAVDGSWATSQALAGQHRTAGEVDITDHLDTIRRYVQARAEAGAAKKHADALANEIKAALGDQDTGLVHGREAVTYRARTRRAHTVAESTYRTLAITWKDPVT